MTENGERVSIGDLLDDVRIDDAAAAIIATARHRFDDAARAASARADAAATTVRAAKRHVDAGEREELDAMDDHLKAERRRHDEHVTGIAAVLDDLGADLKVMLDSLGLGSGDGNQPR
jgi:hypothetical protein